MPPGYPLNYDDGWHENKCHLVSSAYRKTCLPKMLKHQNQVWTKNTGAVMAHHGKKWVMLLSSSKSLNLCLGNLFGFKAWPFLSSK